MDFNNFPDLYDKLFADNLSDAQFYNHFFKENDSILEVGSGTGRLLLHFLKNGLKVDGLDPDKQMNDLCFKKASKLNLSPLIYQTGLENFITQNKYDVMYMPLFVFQHITMHENILLALKNTYDALKNNGRVLISIFLSQCQNSSSWEINKIAQQENEVIIFSEIVENDLYNQIQTKHLKFETYKNNVLKQTQYSKLSFRMYSPNEFMLLLENVGFNNIEIFGDYSLQEPDKDSDVLIFSATKA